MRPLLPLALLLTGCPESGTLGIDSIEDLQAACADATPSSVELEVVFTRAPEGCDFGEDDNLDREDGVITARTKQIVSLQLPEGGVACDLEFDFRGVDPSFEQIMEYDDHMFLTFNDVVLASSSAPLVEELLDVDGLRVWDWDRVAGTPFEFSGVETYCLGEEEGLSECTIPPPETPDPISVSFGGTLVEQLSLRAIEQARFDFGFIVTGDNDDTDCSHERFEFVVETPVIYP